MDNNEEIEVLDNTSSIPTEINEPSVIDTPSTEEPVIVESFDDKVFNQKKKHNKPIKYIILFIILLILLVLAFIEYDKYKNNSYTYTENSTVDYQVCLKENNYYKEKCLNEGVEYITTITDKIRIDFNYNQVYQEKVSNNYSYYIKSSTVIKTTDENAKELYNKSKKLTDKKDVNLNGNVLNITESIDIPFQEQNNYVQKYVNDYSLIGKGNLIVSLMVKDKTSNEEKEVSSISIPLNQVTYNIEKNEIKNNINTYKETSNDLIKNAFLIALIVLGISIIIVTVKLFKSILGNDFDNKYEKELYRILNTYDRVIVTLNDKNILIDDNEIYNVQSFVELLDVRDTIDKPILFYKLSDTETEFYVQDTEKTYMYTMKESDFFNKK